MPADNAPVDPQLRRSSGRRLNAPRLLLVLAGLLVLLSLTRILTGAEDITSGGALGATINLAVPIGLAGLGGLWAERSGVVNIGLEGMMILGTFFGAWFAYETGTAWMTIVGGIVGGVIGAIVHAFATVTIGVDHIVSGVAINVAALGAARFLAGVFFADTPGGGATQSPTVPTFPNLQLPGADTLFGTVERKHWFLVSDVFGLLDGLFTQLTVFTIIAILMVPLTWFILWRTAFGLRLRSCGEKPSAAESLGVNVYRMKWIAVLVSGALAGMAGGFLVQLANIYREGQTANRGYIGLAAMIFGNWRPGGLAAGAGLFGYTDALQLRQGSISVHALLVLVAIILAAGAFRAWRAKRIMPGVVTIVLAGLVVVWYLVTDSLPQELVTYTPQFVTLLVLAFASQRLRPPKADGLVWRKGQRE
ncbi:ABC transporter permease [Jatrophihabitans sp. YIM 134969]